jgi:hypothetical protein
VTESVFTAFPQAAARRTRGRATGSSCVGSLQQRQQVGIRSTSAFLMVGTHASARIGADAAKVDVVEANTWQ